MPPIVTEVTVKLTTPEPELLAVKVPLKVAEKLLLPADGMVCVIVRVNVPEATAPPPVTKVWKLPKLEPVGVLKLVGPSPVNVIMRALPTPFVKVTELVPLPAHTPQVKVPEVENVTGSALASAIPSDTTARSNALMRVALKTPVMICSPFVLPRLTFTLTLEPGNVDRCWAIGTRLWVSTFAT